MPIHTAIGPKPHTRQRYMHRLTRQSHIVQQDTIMENFTSPAARSPYGGMKDGTQQIGLTIVIKVIISKQSRALAGSIPASIVMGFVSMKIIRQLAMITTSDTSDSFFDIVDSFILSAGTQTLSYNSHKTYSYSDSGNTI